MRPIRDGTGVEVTLFGIVKTREIIEASHAIYEVVPLDSQRFQLWDYSAVSRLVASSDEVRAVARVDSMYAEQRQTPLYVASVQPTDLGFGLGRMYGVFADGHNWITAHFRTRAEAERWLDKQLQHSQPD
jgi:hypothetical protein